MPFSTLALPLRAVALLAAGGLAPATAAEDGAGHPWQASVGASYSTVGDVAPFVALHKPFAHWQGFRVEAAAGLIGKHQGAQPGDREHIGWVALGLGRRFGRWEASFSLAASYPKTSALSSVGQFLSQLGYRIDERRLLRIGHLSNGSLHGRNRGETFLALSIDL